MPQASLKKSRVFFYCWKKKQSLCISLFMCLSLSLSELNCFGLVRVVLLFYLHVRGFGFCVGRGFTYFEDDGKRVGKERWCCSCLVFFSFLSLFFSWGVFMNLFFFWVSEAARVGLGLQPNHYQGWNSVPCSLDKPTRTPLSLCAPPTPSSHPTFSSLWPH